MQIEDGCPSGLSISTFGLIADFQELRAAITALASEPHEYRTVVLDSLDATEPLIWKDVCATQGWASIEAPGYGKGYIVVDGWWHDLLKGFEFLRRQRGMSIVLIAHSAIETIYDPCATSFTSYQLRLHKRARGLVQDWCDAIGFLAPDLHVQTEETGFGKSVTVPMAVRSAGSIGNCARRSWQRIETVCPPRCRSLSISVTRRFASYFPQPPADVSAANPQTHGDSP